MEESIVKKISEDKKLTKDLMMFAIKEKNNPSDEKTQMDKLVDIAFDNKKTVDELVDSSKDENRKRLGKIALKDKKLTKDVINFGLDEQNNPSDEKTQMDKLVDIAFNNKKTVGELINTSKDENTKMLSEIALKDKKLTKDVIDFGLDEQKNPSDEKTQINKAVDIAFDNKKTIDELINTSKDEDAKELQKAFMTDKKLTKDIINFGLDEGENIKNKFSEFSKNKIELKTSDYFEFASKNKKQTIKALNIISKNEKGFKKLNNDPKAPLNIALDNKNLSTSIIGLALKDNAKIPKKIENFAEQKYVSGKDCAKFIYQNGEELHDVAKVLSNNKQDVKNIINTFVEDEESREEYKYIVDNTSFEGVATAIEFGAAVYDLFSDCTIF